jgi:uncharacterized damage-inducible protein DinB
MDHVFEREGWHVSLLDSVKDLTAAQAAWSPSPGRNSIWKIVEHVALWKEEEARRLGGEPPRSAGWAKEHDWPDTSEATEAKWQQAFRRLTEAHRTLRLAVATIPDVRLDVAAPGSAASIAARTGGLILHDSYHCGQICYLRALQSIPAKIW